MKIKEIFENENNHGENEKNPDENEIEKRVKSVKKVSEIFEVMMKNERERKSSPYSLEKKKTKKANKTIKRLEPNKTVLDRWLKEQSEPEVKGRKSARESGSSKLLVRKDAKQINDSQENSLGDLNPKVRRHSYQKQNESDINLQKKEEKSLHLVQKHKILSEKVKIWEHFHRSETKNGVAEEKLKKWGQDPKERKSNKIVSEKFKGQNSPGVKRARF